MEPLGQGIWTISFPFQTCGVHFGTRTTVVETPAGLILISPGPLDPDQVNELNSVGAVRALVAPNTMHHLFLDMASEHWPDAALYIPPGLKKKRPELSGASSHEDGLELWGDVLSQLSVEGVPQLQETVFYHHASNTLILTDLAFNFQRCSHWLTRQVMRFNGSLGCFGPSRIFRSLFLRDVELFSASLKRIFDWPFTRVVVAHGEILQTGARDEFERAYKDWLV